MSNFFGRALWATAVSAATAAAALGQVVSDAVPMLSQTHILDGQPSVWQPAGPGEFHGVPDAKTFSTFSTDPRDSALYGLEMKPRTDGGARPPTNTNPGGLQQGGIAGGGGGSRFINQDPSCATGWFSNNNHDSSPYLVFDDFRAGVEPLRNVRFYAGVFGGTGSLDAISTIGVEIWSTQVSGDACGWAYASLAGKQTFTVSEVAPKYHCSGALDFYQMTANFDVPIELTPGEIYMVLVYATLVDPNGSELFAWCQSDMSNYRDATTWDYTTGEYVRCSPDMAFTTNVDVECFEHDCQTTCYFSNVGNNTNSFLSLDDFTASETGDLRQLQFTGGVYNTGTGNGELLGNISGFTIELYHSIATDDPNFPCDHWHSGFLGAFNVSLAEARPVYDCTDLFGIPQYQFTVNIPADVYPLVAGTDYLLGVYGVPVDPDSTELFCWGGTDAVYGRNSFSFNTASGLQEICHDYDQAFCINGDRPCLGDFNLDGESNTLDVIHFLNAWNDGHPSSDINGDGNINTQDVLAFLNRWNIPC
ncbi:MAG: GC-type dockerin domain-anchored protein [Phycisphaerales bacterium JB054]